MTVSDDIRRITREKGLPTRDCGHRIRASDLADPDPTCKECNVISLEDLKPIPINEIMCPLSKHEDGKYICRGIEKPIDGKYCKSMGHYFRIDCPNYRC